MNFLQRKDVLGLTLLFLLDEKGDGIENLAVGHTGTTTEANLAKAILRQLRRTELQSRGVTRAQRLKGLDTYLPKIWDLRESKIFGKFMRGDAVAEKDLAQAIKLNASLWQDA